MVAKSLIRHTVMAALFLLASAGVVWAVPPWYQTGTVTDSGSGIIPIESAANQLFEPLQSYSSSAYGLCLDTVYRFGTFGGTDCWGYKAPDGTEYAFMGTSLGVVIINTANRSVVDTIIGPASGCGSAMWRDLKTYKNYLYAVSECSGTRAGIMIIDLATLPDSAHYLSSFTVTGQVTCHNLSIDTARGYLYAVRSGYDGFRIINLANPVSPVELPFVATGDLHDVMAVNDTVYAAEGTRHTFSIWDMANKLSPALLTRVAIPAGGYVHNIWPTADRQYVATTEETARKTIKLWDISDMNNVQLTSQFIAPDSLAHNAHVEGERIFVSHYESGAVAFDISNPAAPQLVSQFDTWGTENPDFNGNWGIYPHTNNGKVYVSNMDGRFFILNEVAVTNADTLSADSVTVIPNSNITININLHNTHAVRSLQIPIDWSGPFNMSFVSLTTAGTRTSYFQGQEYMMIDFAHGRLVYLLTSSNNGSVPDLAPGSGPVLKLTLHVPGAVAGGPNPIQVDSTGGIEAAVVTSCVTFTPSTIDGGAKLFAPSGCCDGTVGNVDNSPDQSVDVSDLTQLIDHLFITFSPMGCEDEANVDGSANGNVDVADLTALINLLFINVGNPFPPCP